MAIATYADAGDRRAEVAIVVREDFQGQGVAKHLVKRLEAIARKNGYRGFTADVLAENKAMLHVFESVYPNLVKDDLQGEVRLTMDFAD
jgi:GNAT superfamily N-acetyltransferase